MDTVYFVYRDEGDVKDLMLAFADADAAHRVAAALDNNSEYEHFVEEVPVYG
jgi:hypothetical protein